MGAILIAAFSRVFYGKIFRIPGLLHHGRVFSMAHLEPEGALLFGASKIAN
jgi:hypothetical protein